MPEEGSLRRWRVWWWVGGGGKSSQLMCVFRPSCGLIWLYKMNESLGLYDPLFIIPLLQDPIPTHPIPSHPIPSHPTPSYPTLTLPISPHPTVSLPVPSHPIPSHPHATPPHTPPHPTPSHPTASHPTPPYPTPSRTIPSHPTHPTQHHTTPHHTTTPHNTAPRPSPFSLRSSPRRPSRCPSRLPPTTHRFRFLLPTVRLHRLRHDRWWHLLRGVRQQSRTQYSVASGQYSTYLYEASSGWYFPFRQHTSASGTMFLFPWCSGSCGPTSDCNASLHHISFLDFRTRHPLVTSSVPTPDPPHALCSPSPIIFTSARHHPSCPAVSVVFYPFCSMCLGVCHSQRRWIGGTMVGAY